MGAPEGMWVSHWLDVAPVGAEIYKYIAKIGPSGPFWPHSEPRSGEPGRSPEGANSASREAASLDDHPKGLTQRAAKRRASAITRRG